MSAKRYTDKFKIGAVRQIVEYGRPIAEVAERLCVSIHSLYAWKRQQGKGSVMGSGSLITRQRSLGQKGTEVIKRTGRAGPRGDV